jgi:hypothetical protein
VLNYRKLIIPALASATVEAADPVVDWHNQWQSRYVSEGRDNLPGSGLFASALAAQAGRFDATLIHIVEDQTPGGDRSRYREWNVEAGVGGTAAALDWRLGYKQLWFPASDEQDQEFSVELSTELFASLISTLTYTHATEADGAFVEMALAREFSCGQGCQFTPYAMAAANEGFVPDSRRGLNNLQFGTELALQVSERVSLGLEANYSLPAESTVEEALKELFWLGLSLQYRIH